MGIYLTKWLNLADKEKNMIRERLIHLHYDDSDMQLNNANAAMIFASVGKISSFGATSTNSNGSLDYLNVSINSLGTITAGFYKLNDTEDELKKSQRLWEAISEFSKINPVVIQAKKSKDSDYSFETLVGKLDSHTI